MSQRAHEEAKSGNRPKSCQILCSGNLSPTVDLMDPINRDHNDAGPTSRFPASSSQPTRKGRFRVASSDNPAYISLTRVYSFVGSFPHIFLSLERWNYLYLTSPVVLAGLCGGSWHDGLPRQPRHWVPPYSLRSKFPH
jgi:hypothetical protein